MENKLLIKDVIIKATDDAVGEVLMTFLQEFTEVEFKNGCSLEYYSPCVMKFVKREENIKQLIFIIIDNKLSWEDSKYLEEIMCDEGNAVYVYDSVKAFLLNKNEWIEE